MYSSHVIYKALHPFYYAVVSLIQHLPSGVIISISIYFVVWRIVCGRDMSCDKCPERDWERFSLASWPGMLCGVWQERHQHEQAGSHLTGGKIPRLWHEDPAPHQGLRLGFRKGNWLGWGEPDGCLAPMYGKNVKRLLSLSLLLLLHFVGYRGKWGHMTVWAFSQLEVFGVVFV